MQPYRIAYIFTPTEFGGAERVNITFLNNVDRNLFTLYPVVFIRPWEKENVVLRELEKAEYACYEVPVAQKPRAEGRDYFRLIRSYARVHSFLRTGAFDIVHTHGYLADILGIAAAKTLGIPAIATSHGFIPSTLKFKIYIWFDCLSLRHADRIIAVSEGVKQTLMANGIPESRVALIQNAVNQMHSNGSGELLRAKKRAELGISSSEFVVGYVGRLSEEKGVRYLIHAGALASRSGIPVRLIIIGDGPQRPELEEFASRTCSGDVLFTGFQSNIESWFPTMDAFVLPSLTEGTPISLLEAMASGVPVLSTAVGGVPQVIESGKNGILVNPAAAAEISSGLQSLYHDAALRNRMIQAAKDTICKKYDVHHWARRIEAQYLDILNQN